MGQVLGDGLQVSFLKSEPAQAYQEFIKDPSRKDPVVLLDKLLAKDRKNAV